VSGKSVIKINKEIPEVAAIETDTIIPAINGSNILTTGNRCRYCMKCYL